MTVQELMDAMRDMPAKAVLERNQVGNLSVFIDGKWIGWLDLADNAWGENRFHGARDEEVEE